MGRTDSFVEDGPQSSYKDFGYRFSKYSESLHIRNIVKNIPQETTFDRESVDKGSDSGAEEKGKIEIHQTEYFKQWIGRIIKIESKDCFIAKIEELKGNRLDQKIVRFNRNKVTFANSDHFEEGAVFYWTVGVFHNEKKMMVKRSEIRFQLLNDPSPIIVKEMEDEIGKVFDGITWLE